MQKRKCPLKLAKEFNLKTVKKGLDGKKWIVYKRTDGVKTWKRKINNKKGGNPLTLPENYNKKWGNLNLETNLENDNNSGTIIANDTVYDLLNDGIKIYTQNLLSVELYGATFFWGASHSLKDSLKGITNDEVNRMISNLRMIIDTLEIKYQYYCGLSVNFYEEEYNNISKIIMESNANNPNALNNKIRILISLKLLESTKFKLICKTYDKLESLLNKNDKIIFMLQEVDFIYKEMIEGLGRKYGCNFTFGKLFKYGPTQCIICKNIKCSNFTFTFTTKLYNNWKKMNETKENELVCVLLNDYKIIISSIHIPAMISKNKDNYQKYTHSLFDKITLLKEEGYNLLIGGDYNRILHLTNRNNNFSKYSTIHQLYPKIVTGLPVNVINKLSNGNYPGIDGFIVTDPNYENYKLKLKEFYKLNFKNTNNNSTLLNKINTINNINSRLVKQLSNNTILTGSDHMLVELTI